MHGASGKDTLRPELDAMLSFRFRSSVFRSSVLDVDAWTRQRAVARGLGVEGTLHGRYIERCIERCIERYIERCIERYIERCARRLRRATALARWQMGDSERHARGRARPSNPPRTPRRRRASLRHETKKGHPRVTFFVFLAERGGFEPPVEYYPTHAFQACAFSRSAISPALLPSLSRSRRL